MVDVADDDGQQTEHQYNSCGIDDWVERFEAVGDEFSPAQVLFKRSIKQIKHLTLCNFYFIVWPRKKLSQANHTRTLL